jgi:NADH-quinone oxidoreductase subunit A
MTDYSLIRENMVWPLLIYAGLVLLVVVFMLGLSFFLGQRSKDHSHNEPYESGIDVTGSARLRFPARFYLIAMFFVLFDIESVFIISWAIAFRELGWTGYVSIAIFILILFVLLLFEWRTGALNFETTGKQILNAMHKKEKSDISDKH